MSEFLEILSPSALKDLQSLNNELVKTVSNVKEVNSNMIGAKTPSGSDSAIKALNAELAKQQELYAKVQIQLERYAQAQNRTKISNNALEKSNIALEASIIRKNKALEREEAKQSILSNVYQKTQRQLNLVTAEYNNLSAKKERYNNLTENEEKRLITLTNVSKKYQLTLQGIDTAVGKYSRNVGNYASGFNPLSNAIGQISRELPNFGQSMQIGIMSITNNIGALQDAVKGIVAQNAILKAEGQATRSVMSQIGASILSFNTLLYVGVAVLSAYGKEIGIWVESLFQGDKALKDLTDRQKEFNNARLGGRKDAQAEILELRKYLAVVNDKKLSLEQQKIAQNALLKQYPYYIKSVKDAMLIDGQYSKGVNDLITALEKRKEVEKKSELNVLNRQKLIDLSAELDVQKRLEEQAQLSIKTGVKNGATARTLAIYSDDLRKAQEKRILIQNQIDAITKQTIKNDEDIIKLKKETIGLEYQEEKASKSKVAQKKKEAEQLKQFTEDWFQSEISKLEAIRGKVAETTEEYASYTNQINVLRMLLEQLQGKEVPDTLRKEQLEALDEGIKKMKSYEETVVKTKEETDELRKSTDEWIESFRDGFFADAGLPTLLKALKGDIKDFGVSFTETFLGITQIAQEAFAFITEASNANFANEYANLERQRDIALAFAGDSASARAEIEAEAERRRRDIQKREFQAKKQQALFNIAVDTAQAIVAALPNIPLSITIGLIGAVQAGVVASQQMPQFWKGTDNAPEGLALTQERGREIITDKYGRIKSTGSDKGAQVTYLNKGDKVLNNEKTMDFLMFNNDLNSILTGNGISAPKVDVSNSGMTDSQVNAIVSAIKTKETANISIDKKGIKDYVTNGRQITERMNNRVEFKGRSI